MSRRVGVGRRAVLGAVAAVIATAANAVETPGALDGFWQGQMAAARATGVSTPSYDFNVRLYIQGATVRVYMDEGEGFQEVKPGTFNIVRDGTNAVITSIQADPARPAGAGWVETWSFAITLWDEDELMANYVRVVNNNDVPAAENPNARFSQIRTGRLQRVYPDHV